MQHDWGSTFLYSHVHDIRNIHPNHNSITVSGAEKKLADFTWTESSLQWDFYVQDTTGTSNQRSDVMVCIYQIAVFRSIRVQPL